MSHTGSNCIQMQKKLIQTGKAKEVYFQGMRWWLCPISTVVIQLLSVQLFTTPWTVARQASLSHYLLEFAQIHVHWVGDAIQPSLFFFSFFSLQSIGMIFPPFPQGWATGSTKVRLATDGSPPGSPVPGILQARTLPIQPSHLLLSPSFAFSLSQHQGLF